MEWKGIDGWEAIGNKKWTEIKGIQLSVLQMNGMLNIKNTVYDT